MHIVILPISEIKPYENNPRINTAGVDAVAKSMREFGVRSPILVDKDNVIIYGHTRLQAAKLNGMAEYPCIVANDMSPEKARAYRIADNHVASHSTWDEDKLRVELMELKPFPFKELPLLEMAPLDFMPAEMKAVGFMASTGSLGEDEVPKVSAAVPTTQLGNVWRLGNHRLLCGNATNPEQITILMNGEKPELLYTDPPYGLADKWTGGTWGSNPMYADAKRWDQPLKQTTIDWLITLAPHVVIWGANNYCMPPSRCWISWYKTQRMETMADFELAWTNFDKVSKAWDGARNADGKRMHPTQKPVALMEWGITNFIEARNVLDVFGGSGSTLIACEKTNRTCFMMELDPHYCDVIVARWEGFTGQKAEVLA